MFKNSILINFDWRPFKNKKTKKYGCHFGNVNRFFFCLKATKTQRKWGIKKKFCRFILIRWFFVCLSFFNIATFCKRFVLCFIIDYPVYWRLRENSWYKTITNESDSRNQKNPNNPKFQNQIIAIILASQNLVMIIIINWDCSTFFVLVMFTLYISVDCRWISFGVVFVLLRYLIFFLTRSFKIFVRNNNTCLYLLVGTNQPFID